MDEEKPTEKSKAAKEGKQDEKQLAYFTHHSLFSQTVMNNFRYQAFRLPLSPHLQLLAPPPDAG